METLMEISIYHNPRCSKSRATLEILREHGVEPTIIEYLQSAPDSATIAQLVEWLGIGPEELMRQGDPDYKAHAVALRAMDQQQQIDWLAQHISVFERPVVVRLDHNPPMAVIGRPPENVLALLEP